MIQANVSAGAPMNTASRPKVAAAQSMHNKRMAPTFAVWYDVLQIGQFWPDWNRHPGAYASGTVATVAGMAIGLGEIRGRAPERTTEPVSNDAHSDVHVDRGCAGGSDRRRSPNSNGQVRKYTGQFSSVVPCESAADGGERRAIRARAIWRAW